MALGDVPMASRAQMAPCDTTVDTGGECVRAAWRPSFSSPLVPILPKFRLADGRGEFATSINVGFGPTPTDPPAAGPGDVVNSIAAGPPRANAPTTERPPGRPVPRSGF